MDNEQTPQQFSATTTAPAVEEETHISWVLLGAGAVAAVAVWGVLTYLGVDVRQVIFGSSDQQQVQEERSSEVVVTNVRSGDYESASDAYNKIVANEAANPEQRALAVWSAAEINYKLSGDIQDAVDGIRELKETVLDTRVSPRVRAGSLRTMVGIYYGSAGRHPAVFEEMFRGEPFNQYLVPGDGYLSTRKLHEWAYSIYPTSNVAIKLAQWFVIEPFENDELTVEEIDSYLAEAQRYLNEAAALEELELELEGPRLTESRRYASNQYWVTFIQTALALHEDDGSYDYAQAYEDLFTFLRNSPNGEVAQYLPYAHWLYANFLVKFDGDVAAAQEQLAQTISLVENDPRPEANEFASFVRNTPVEGTELISDQNFFTSMVKDMVAIDENFASFIRTLNPSLVPEA